MTQFSIFKLSDICKFKSSSTIIKIDTYTTPYITATSKNNGVLEYRNLKASCPKNSLTISKEGYCGYAFVQSLDFAAKNHVAVVELIIPNISELQKVSLLYYIGACYFIKEQGKYNRFHTPHLKDIKNFKIQLPTKEGTIDFGYLTNLLEKIKRRSVDKIRGLLYG